MPAITQSWQAAGADGIAMRIGIHHGPAIVGNFGSRSEQITLHRAYRESGISY